MNETEIRVVFPRIPPGMYDDCTKFPTLKSSINCPKPGICAEIIRAIALRQNLRIVPIVPPTARGDTAIGAYVNGTWVGMLGYLANGSADTVCLFYAETDFRRKHFDFSDVVYVPQNAFAVGHGKDVLASGMWDFFDPYKLEMWLAMLLIFLAQCTIIFIAFVEYRSKKRTRFEPGEVVWQLVRLQLRQVSSIRFYSDAGRVHMLVFAFMQCLLLLSLYQGWILSSLINHKDSKPFSNMDEMIDLIARGRYRLVTNSPGHWFFELIQNSSKYNFIRLRNATERHPVVIVRSEKEAMDFVEHSNGIIPTQTDYTTMFESPCAISFVRFNIVERSAHFLFPKGSPFRAIFNEALDKERIAMARLERRYFERPYELKKRKCERTLRKRMAMRPLQVSPYLGVLIVSAAGVCMAVLAFVLEKRYFTRIAYKKCGLQPMPYADRLKYCDLESLEYRRKVADLAMVYKIINKKIRRQVLPKETLLAVFSCSKRADLDQWGTVSRQYDATIQRADQLRQVETVTLRYAATKKLYMAVIVYKESMKADPKEEPEHKRLIRTSANVSDIIEAFFRCLRYCTVNVRFRIDRFPIDRSFIARLKHVSKDFDCESKKIELSSLNELKDGLGSFDLFCAFPSHRAVSSSTLSFLCPNYKDSSDAFLRSLADHDVWDVGDAGQSVFMPATDEAILDFAFSARSDDDGVRRLSIITDKVSSQFLAKLVKACRECQRAHPLDINLEAEGDFDVDELTANGELQTIKDGDYRGCPVWKFRFEDLRDFEVVYLPGGDQGMFYGANIHFWRGCTPSFMFLQKSSCEL